MMRKSDLPTVSFVMPAYNAGMFIADAIKSVLAQTIDDWELVVVDDGSSDDTVEVAESFSATDCRIRVFRNDKNSGNAFPPRKAAVELSRGEIIAPLDADDEVEPCYLEKLLHNRSEFKTDVVYPVMHKMSVTGEKGGRYLPDDMFDMSVPYTGKELVRYTLDGWRIGTGGGIIGKDFYLKCMDSVEAAILMNADEYLTRIILIEASTVKICDTRYFYRENQNSITREVSLKKFDILKTDYLLGKLIHFHFEEDSEECKRMEIQKFCDLIDSVRYFNRNKDRFPPASHKKIKDMLHNAYRSVDWGYIKKYGGWKYYLLFRIGLTPAMKILNVL
ncbi:MAG: glycosyltransferase family 2 protein [Muribaculaceae bacterium]|nr:glycosyltransferase family 2 protein [Muribaculaceae bacterium]MDE5713465.1 glycosyltransferase family 2 protein [Muribaculaceae bacterium]